MMVSASELGYEEAVPSAAELGYDNEALLQAAATTSARPAPAELGYEEGTPTFPGTTSASDTVASITPLLAGVDLGYEDAKPEPTSGERGYEQPGATSADSVTITNASQGLLPARNRLRRFSGRYSMGGTPIPGTGTFPVLPESSQDNPPQRRSRSSMQRRATIDHQPTVLSTPCQYTHIPRRSSLAHSSACKSDDVTGFRRQQQEQHQKAQRRVSFGGHYSNPIPTLDSFSPEEVNSMWYDRRELNELRQKLRQIIRQERILDETQDCWRGLEVFVKQQERKSGLSTSENDQELYTQVILQLAQMQTEVAAVKRRMSTDYTDNDGRDDDTGTRFLQEHHLQQQKVSQDSMIRFAKKLLRKARRMGKDQAAQDAAEAHAIYLETMDADLVHTHFQNE